MMRGTAVFVQQRDWWVVDDAVSGISSRTGKLESSGVKQAQHNFGTAYMSTEIFSPVTCVSYSWV